MTYGVGLRPKRPRNTKAPLVMPATIRTTAMIRPVFEPPPPVSVEGGIATMADVGEGVDCGVANATALLDGVGAGVAFAVGVGVAPGAGVVVCAGVGGAVGWTGVGFDVGGGVGAGVCGDGVGVGGVPVTVICPFMTE